MTSGEEIGESLLQRDAGVDRIAGRPTPGVFLQKVWKLLKGSKLVSGRLQKNAKKCKKVQRSLHSGQEKSAADGRSCWRAMREEENVVARCEWYPTPGVLCKESGID